MASSVLVRLSQRGAVGAPAGLWGALRGPPSSRGASGALGGPGDYLQRSPVPTMHYQNSLPKLPIPTLEDSMRRYMKAQEPFLNDEQFRTTEKLCWDFKNGTGKTLHELLVYLDASNPNISYISELSLDAYLAFRESTVFNSNMAFTFHADPAAEQNDQLIRATNLTISSIRFLKTLRDGYLEPEVMHFYPEKTDNKKFKNLMQYLSPDIACLASSFVKAYPLDMSQFSRLFNTFRLPMTKKDELITTNEERHVLVIRNGNFYIFDILDQNKNIVKPSEIHAHLKFILSDGIPTPEHPVGYLTSEHRDTWARLRKELVSNDNEDMLKKMDSALFCLCLDDVSVMDTDHFIHILHHGDGMNRWSDKSFSLIVTKDGHAGVNFEGFWGDGGAVSRFMSEVFLDSTQVPAITSKDKPANVHSPDSVTRLDFKLNSFIKTGISQAKENFEDKKKLLTFRCFCFEQEGRAFFKKQNVNLDAMIQLSFQMAFLSLYGQTVPTYKECSTAVFKHGRTETIHPSSVYTKKCSEAFIKKSLNYNVSDFQKMMARCASHHVKLIKEAFMGQGFNQHLLALRLLAENENIMVPNFFLDPAYLHLSTSNTLWTHSLRNPLLDNIVFAPVAANGITIGYVAHNNCLKFTVSSYSNRNVEEFSHEVLKWLGKIFQVLEGQSIHS